ncbi:MULTISPECIES: bifunctional 3'-5' exonuclease/DNA polymerase [Streptomycetaceae]|uniref:DNA-directed DNA polymerase n=1 Tax=Streptantibioticus cattleyicolor (strain ATCC 35852 / DSM 46488 / JCM 4925 / NBRC 14057 / NRRL 8057) TaxID=1003195 RepID=F8K1E6_STREN|nr:MULTISPECIES: bifunctional 3'-5' exonuclease/DNA polymerase [Streptomycetaceae]AEW97441.1 DNA-directed DNA polymerase [Streptantibioticus cattleyicolor NRRL 8057 = DSM 46488]MYS61879.1 bifunctional 3'-5' exonuclease/DNA polymerase [Streptomyces sp. SID5468]CCB77761.1 DNA-directed DNA polymerase [Streptantibioticus cattleyicolor NRRL 8057 = DSM 46488]
MTSVPSGRPDPPPASAAASARVAVAPDPVGPGGRLQPLADDGTPLGPPRTVPDLARAVAEREAEGPPRWVWAATDELYARLLDRLPVRLARCHDLKLVEALLLGYEERHARPRSLGAAWARLHGLPEPADPRESGADDQPALFAADRHRLPPGTDHLAAVVAVHAAQLGRVAEAGHPGRLRVLCAAESAGALAAVEMGRDGLPWSADEHDAVLTSLLGPRPAGTARPEVLGRLTEEFQRAVGAPVNPDSPAQVLAAFARSGVALPSTRSHVLRESRHPAAAVLLRYKELSRIHSAHGWAWREQWVRGGRFRPEYVVGGVVSGRWATRGGGALQIPRLLRPAVRADPGHRLVVADAGQLEPRVLAALSGDPGLVRAAAGGDLYAGLARAAFDGDRSRAKIGLLAAMYGQTGGEAGRLVAELRRRFPAAMELLEATARTGEAGGTVRSRLGRTSPRPADDWQQAAAGAAGDEEDASPAQRAARAWGRFTRNFVVQASAADWALALLAALRRRLAGSPGARLVFFVHDEVVVHCPAALAPVVASAVTDAAAEATALVFGPTPVPFPLGTQVVECYADAK